MHDHALIFYNNIMYLSAKVPMIARLGSNVGFDAMNNVHKFTQCRLAISVDYAVSEDVTCVINCKNFGVVAAMISGWKNFSSHEKVVPSVGVGSKQQLLTTFHVISFRFKSHEVGLMRADL